MLTSLDSPAAGRRHRQPSPPAPPLLPPQQQQQQQHQQSLPQHVLALQQRQRSQEARAERAGLPVPPPATGKGGRGKLVFPQSDSFRFVLHIRELTKDKNLPGVLAALAIAERREGGVDVHGYQVCIGGMAKAKRWADALGLLSRMRAAGVAPNTHCFSNAIQVCFGGEGDGMGVLVLVLVLVVMLGGNGGLGGDGGVSVCGGVGVGGGGGGGVGRRPLLGC